MKGNIKVVFEPSEYECVESYKTTNRTFYPSVGFVRFTNFHLMTWEKL